MKPQQVAQYQKAGRGFLVTRNSATLADTDYEHVAKEIVAALNDRTRMVEALRHCEARLLHGPDANPNDGLLHDVKALLASIG